MCKVQLTTDEEKTLQVGRTLAGSRVRRPFQKIDKSGCGLKKKNPHFQGKISHWDNSCATEWE